MDNNSDINEEYMQYGGRNNDRFNNFVARVFILDANPEEDGESVVVIGPNIKNQYYVRDTNNFVKFFGNTDINTTLYNKALEGNNRLYLHGGWTQGKGDLLPGIVKDMSSVKLAEMLQTGNVEGIDSRPELTKIAPAFKFIGFDSGHYWEIFSTIKHYEFDINDLFFIFDNNHNDYVEKITFDEIKDNPLELINKDIPLKLINNINDDDEGRRRRQYIFEYIYNNIAKKIYDKLNNKDFDKTSFSSIIIVRGGRDLIRVEEDEEAAKAKAEEAAAKAKAEEAAAKAKAEEAAAKAKAEEAAAAKAKAEEANIPQAKAEEEAGEAKAEEEAGEEEAGEEEEGEEEAEGALEEAELDESKVEPEEAEGALEEAKPIELAITNIKKKLIKQSHKIGVAIKFSESFELNDKITDPELIKDPFVVRVLGFYKDVDDKFDDGKPSNETIKSQFIKRLNEIIEEVAEKEAEKGVEEGAEEAEELTQEEVGLTQEEVGLGGSSHYKLNKSKSRTKKNKKIKKIKIYKKNTNKSKNTKKNTKKSKNNKKRNLINTKKIQKENKLFTSC